MESFTIKSRNSNHYLFCGEKNIIILSNEIMNYVFDEFYIHHKTPSKNILLKIFPSHKVSEVESVLKRFNYYLKNDFFKSLDFDAIFSGKLSEETIFNNIIQSNQLTFEVTTACNLNCTYCTFGKLYSKSFRNDYKNLTFEIAKSAIDYFFKIWNSPNNVSYGSIKRISFYGGEPLLNLSLLSKIVNYVNNECNLLYNKIEYTMTTNGVLLEKHIDFLVNNNFKLLISLDGNEENNEYRKYKDGKSSYKDIVGQIERIRKKYPDYFKNCIRFNAVLHNKNNVSDLYNHFMTAYDKIINISELSADGLNENYKEEFWKMYNNLYDSLQTAEDYSVLKSKFYLDLPDTLSASRFVDQYKPFKLKNYFSFFEKQGFGMNYIPTGTCIPFSRKIFISATGKILPCERIDHKFSLGTITKKGVELDLLKISSQFNLLYEKIKKRCKTCYFSTYCLQCIFHVDEFDKLKCNGYANKFDFLQFVENQINFLEENPLLVSKSQKSIFHE